MCILSSAKVSIKSTLFWENIYTIKKFLQITASALPSSKKMLKRTGQNIKMLQTIDPYMHCTK